MNEVRQILRIARELVSADKMYAYAYIKRGSMRTFTHLKWNVPGKPTGPTDEIKKRISRFEKRVKKMAKAMNMDIRYIEMRGNGLHASSEFGKLSDDFEENARRVGFKVINER